MPGLSFDCPSEDGGRAFTRLDPAAQQSDCLAQTACNWLDQGSITGEVASLLRESRYRWTLQALDVSIDAGIYIN
jgi:hypothetical protein